MSHSNYKIRNEGMAKKSRQDIK